MGWDSINLVSTNYKSVKKQLDSIFCDGYEVMKSAMVGSTYYAAVKCPDGRVTASVILTRIDNNDYFNFSYKPMDESMGPNEIRCPQSILNILSRPDNERSESWRIRCETYNANTRELSRIPFGGKVMVDGKQYEKCKYKGRKKWINWKDYTWLSESIIAEVGFEL